MFYRIRVRLILFSCFILLASIAQAETTTGDLDQQVTSTDSEPTEWQPTDTQSSSDEQTNGLPEQISIQIEPFEHDYEIRFGALRARAVRRLEKLDEDTYELSVRGKNLISSHTERSRFRLDENGFIYPLEHSTKTVALGIRRKEVTQFDWETGTATWTRRKREASGPIEPGMLDRLSYQLLFPALLEQGRKDIQFAFFDRGRRRQYQFEVLGEEQIDIAGQSVTSLKIHRIRENSTKETYIWVLPESEYRLAKIQHIDSDGADYELRAKTLK